MLITPNLLVDDFILALTHIGSVLESFKVLVPKYPLGLKVRTVDNNESFSWVITGRICGFNYIQHPKYESGWCYHIAIEESILTLKDGTIKRDTANDLDFISEHKIELID